MSNPFTPNPGASPFADQNKQAPMADTNTLLAKMLWFLGQGKMQIIDSAGTVIEAFGTPASGPSGASAANQLLEIAALNSLDSKTTIVNTNAVMITATVLASNAATATLQTTGNNSLGSIDGKMPSLGQALMAASVPVTLASDQPGIPVTQSGTWNVNNITGSITLPTGASTALNQATANASLASIDSHITKCNTDAVILATGGNVIGIVNQGTSPWVISGAVTISSGSITVSGTVTANIGTTGGLALDATLAKLTITQGTALGANTGAMIMGSVTTAAPTYTTGQISPLNLTTGGALRVDASAATVTVSGTVAATQSGTWTVQQGTTPSATPWYMRNAPIVDELYSGTTSLTPKFAFANVTASSTDTALVAAVTNKKILVLSFSCMAGATATSVTFNSKPAGAGSAITEAFQCGINGGICKPYSPVGYFRSTNVTEGISVTTGAGSTVGVSCVYVEV